MIFFRPLFIAALVSVTFHGSLGNTLYVKYDAIGTNDGTSWINAFSTITDALTGSSPNDTLWVSEGDYYTTSSSDIYASIEIPHAVSIYGGFNGTETDLSQRDSKANKTIISGNIALENDSTDNSRVLLRLVDLNGVVIIDGFTIEDGHCGSFCNGTSASTGIFIDDCDSVYIVNTSISNNAGRAIFSQDTYTEIINCIIENNSMVHTGGGGIVANSGGVMTVFGSVINNNHSASTAGGIFTIQSSFSGPMPATRTYVVNSNITNNTGTASLGVGVSTSNEALTYVSNSIIWGNTSTSQGSSEEIQIANYSNWGDTYLTHSIVESYTGTAELTGISVSGSDPLFHDALYGDSQYVQQGSPVVDMGINDSIIADYLDLDQDNNVSEMIPLDVLGNSRVFSSTNSTVDIGAFESEYTSITGTSTSNITHDPKLQAYPNPSHDELSISIKNTDYVEFLDVIDLEGTVIVNVLKSTPLNSGCWNARLNLNGLSGVYFLRLKTANGVTHLKLLR